MDIEGIAEEILQNLELMLGPFTDREMAKNIVEVTLEENLVTNE